MAVSNPYAAGAKVYNGGSSAATVGKVDPTGYIDRSLNNSPAPSGSYTPGVAAAALNTLRPATSSTQQSATPQAVSAPISTPTKSSPTGSIGYNLPIDYDLQLKGIDAGANYQNLLNQITSERNAASQNETIGLRNLGQQKVSQERTDLNSAAYRGMARSSGYVDQVDRTATTFNNAQNDIENKFYAALNDATSRDVAGHSQYDSIMAAVYREATARLAQREANDPTAGAIDPLPGDPTGTGAGGLNGAGSGNSGGTPGGNPARKPVPTPKPKPSVGSGGSQQLHTVPTAIRAPSGATLASLSAKYKIPIATLQKLNPGLKRTNGKWTVFANSSIKLR